MKDSVPLRIGAVVYAPQVTATWQRLREFVEAKGIPANVCLYSNYEMLVQEFVRGSTDVIWCSPLAWLRAQRTLNGACRAIAMRDTDRDRASHIVVRTTSAVRTLADLRGKILGFGAADSPQATLIPAMHLAVHGLEEGRDYRAVRFDVLLGLHGDHIGGELDAFQALQGGEVDACTMLDLNWDRWRGDGVIDPHAYLILESTPRFDQGVFAAREELSLQRQESFVEALLSMRYDDPAHRNLMDLEGLKAWVPGRTSGFGPLREALSRSDAAEAAR